MRFGTLCSGIGAPEVAWIGSMGWMPLWCAEIEPFPSAVLKHHYPYVPNLGDMRGINGAQVEPVDVVIAGTPCQSFSVAGKRTGLDDPRGVLAFEYLRIVGEARPQWCIFENVPGLLSSDGGRDFGAFLRTLAELGYGFGYRVLDAKYWGVPQLRRRIFVVGHLGDWRRAGAVLFERESLRGDPSPRRKARTDAARNVAACLNSGGNDGGFRTEPGEHIVAHPLTTHGQRWNLSTETLMSTLRAHNPAATGHVVADTSRDNFAVRRLTCRECERLQGFPDDYTRIPWRGKPAKDTPRYRAVGNSMAVPVVRWLGERIAACGELALECEEVRT